MMRCAYLLRILRIALVVALRRTLLVILLVRHVGGVASDRGCLAIPGVLAVNSKVRDGTRRSVIDRWLRRTV
jgi:hypothetical protein